MSSKRAKERSLFIPLLDSALCLLPTRAFEVLSNEGTAIGAMAIVHFRLKESMDATCTYNSTHEEKPG